MAVLKGGSYVAGDLSVAANLYAGASVTAAGYVTSSKRELKENIEPFKDSGLDIINSTEIVTYNMKVDPLKNLRVGFIADDTSEYLAGENHDKMDLCNTIGVLLKAIQELSAEVDMLKKEVAKTN